ncbi:hypothetical protein DL765_003483 [Monosporascus sp. GIB2]|nr:hypothetical protein DL765_003483 [Monosporascus sp. GIB2]
MKTTISPGSLTTETGNTATVANITPDSKRGPSPSWNVDPEDLPACAERPSKRPRTLSNLQHPYAEDEGDRCPFPEENSIHGDERPFTKPNSIPDALPNPEYAVSQVKQQTRPVPEHSVHSIEYGHHPEDVRRDLSTVQAASKSTASYPVSDGRNPTRELSKQRLVDIEELRSPLSPGLETEGIGVGTTSKTQLSGDSNGAAGTTLSPDTSTIEYTSTPRDHATFQYQGVQGVEFRLLRLLPETVPTIKCEFVPASLENHPKYVAVSYAWGDVDDTVQIQVDGLPLMVTSSLHGALNALRRSEPVLLWADAICINQRNKDEQSHQVRMMTSIYSQAESVAVWLGPEMDDSDLAVELLQAVSKIAGDSEAMHGLIASENWRRHFTALVCLFERDYWSRLWVVQEVLNATSVTVYCGGTNLPWKTYIDASDMFKLHGEDLNYYYHAAKRDGSRFLVSQQLYSYEDVLRWEGPASIHILGLWKDAGAASFLDTLVKCRRKLASDPRDKVFGLLGFLPSEIRSRVPIDYNASVKEVYTNVVDFCLHATRRLDVICESFHFPSHTGTVKLPSWVPDWSHITAQRSLSLCYDFSAAADSDAEFRTLSSQWI